MKYNRIASALIVALAGTIALSACKKKEEPVAAPAPVAVEPAPVAAPAAPPAISFAGLTVGTTAAPDKSVAAVTAFTPKDAIIASVKTDGTSSNAAITAKLTFQDGQVAGPEQSQSVSAAGPETTNFTFTNTKPWPTGKYKVDVTLNGAAAGSQEIEVK